MPAISMPEARLTPAQWTAEIDAALTPGTVTRDLKTRWNTLKVKNNKDGTWHKDVKEKVVVPYNVIHGGWSGTTMIGTKTYGSLSKAYAKGSSDFVIGGVMPGGFDTIAGAFDNTTKGVFRNLWQQGASGGRGETTFSKGERTVSLDHKRIGAGRSQERLWYINVSPYTAYLVTDHVDTTSSGKAVLAALTSEVAAWLEAETQPILAGYLHLETSCSQLYVITTP